MTTQMEAQARPAAEGERYERATKVLDDIFTPAWRNIQSGSQSAAGQDFGRMCVEHCYADAWSRPTLDYKTRSVITLSALAAMGLGEELKMHVRIALNVGHSPDDIAEIFIHLVPYVGVPKMVQAMRHAGEVFAQAAQSQKS